MLHSRKNLRRALVALLFFTVVLAVCTPKATADDPPVDTYVPEVYLPLWFPNYFGPTELQAAWEITRGSPVIIAVVGSGVAPLTDMAPNLLPGYNTWDDSTDTNDINDHDTYVASIIAAADNNNVGTVGVCPLCKILPVRVSGLLGDDYKYEDIAEGINWAAVHGARIINLSIATSKSCPAINRAISDAIKKGIVVVISSGNHFKGTRAMTHSYPKNYIAIDNPLAIRVANAETPEQLYHESNAGGRQSDVAAIGTNVPADSAFGYFMRFTGTSAATPVVSGTAGLLLSKYPFLTPKQVKTIVMASCGKGRKKLNVPCGGVVSAYRALSVAQNPPEPLELRLKVRGKGEVLVAGEVVSGQYECRNKCSYEMLAGQTELKTAPTPGWRFVRWTGGISSKKSKLTINIKAAKSVKAVFVRVKTRR